MTNWRRPLLTLGVALLYIGIVLGGMALPFAAAAAFGTAALVGYNALMRPVKSWAPNGPAFGLSLVVLAATSALLVAFGANLTRWAAPPPALVGPVASLLGLAVSRLGWSAAKAEAMDDFLSEATQTIESLAREMEQSLRAEPLTDLPELDRATAEALTRLRTALPSLPDGTEARTEAMAQLVAPLEPGWSSALEHLSAAQAPREREAAAHLLLSPTVLPQAFGHPDAEPVLAAAFLSGDAALAEAAARRALSLDLDTAECWRLLPSAEALNEAARLADDPPALTALTAAISEREAEDFARRD